MKNSEIIMLSKQFPMLGNLKGNNGKSPKFAYAVARNAKKVASEVVLIQKAEPPAYKKFIKEQTDLAESHAKKDEKGKPVTTPDGRNYVIEDNDKLDADIEKLKEKHKGAEEEYSTFMDTERDIELHMVDLAEVPSDITVQLMTIIECMILDTEAVKPEQKAEMTRLK